MIQSKSLVNLADNSGIINGKCIKALGGFNKKYASVGNIIIFSAKNIITSNNNIKKGDVHYGVIVRTQQTIFRKDGSNVKFKSNSIVLIDKQKHFLGTKIYGSVSKNLRIFKYVKILILSLNNVL